MGLQGRLLAAAVTVLIACGGASVDPHDGVPSSSNGGSSSGGSSGGGSSSGGSSSGGSSGSSGGAPWEGTDAGKVDIGDCVFEDPSVELLVRYEILQADRLDGSVDGSVGPEAVTTLSVSQNTLAISGLECLTNLEQLWLSVYGEGEAPKPITQIAGLSRLRKLSLYGPLELAGVLAELSLERLILNRVPLTHLEEVSSQTALRELYLEDDALTSLKGAEQLSALETLRIDGAELTDLSPLAAISNLVRLEFRHIPGLRSLEGLEPHTRLEQFTAYDVPIESLIPLSGANGMEILSVGDSELTSLDGLEGKLALESLTVRGSGISDLSPLSGLPALRYLTLVDNAIDDISPLSSCAALVTLEVAGNSIESLAPVATLADLNHLDAARNALTAIDVELPPSLESLFLANNPVSSLAPIAGHTLRTLDISSTALESLAPLFDLPELERLYADDIGVTNLEAFPLAQLVRLSLKDNQIENIAALHGLGDLSVDLTGNQVVHLPEGFIGPAAPCGGGLVLLDNPLSDAAKARLEVLCKERNASYSWDGGECDACPRV